MPGVELFHHLKLHSIKESVSYTHLDVYKRQDQNGEQRNVADQIALRAELARRHAHTERDAGLRQQRDAEILADLRLTFHELCGVVRAEILAKLSLIHI